MDKRTICQKCRIQMGLEYADEGEGCKYVCRKCMSVKWL